MAELAKKIFNFLFPKDNKMRRNIFLTIASVVVFTTTYMLILPAITASTTTYCGQEEHTHTDACYETKKTLTCGKKESDGHEHTDDCYETVKKLICGEEESDGHQHTDSCYTEEKVLTCTNTDEDHEHDDSCYTVEKKLTCGIEEGEGAHHHTSDCYKETEKLTCGKEEGQGAHQHTASCYKETKTLVCNKKEHTHTTSCYSDEDADVESKATWEKTMDNAKLTGKWSEDVITIAKTQLGYDESTRNYEVDDNGNKKGYTRYGDWYGVKYGDWCAMFCSFCIHYANIPTSSDYEVYVPIEAGCQAWIEKLNKKATPYYYAYNDDNSYELINDYDDYTMESGDLIFFNWDSEPDADHVGLIESINYNEDGSIKNFTTIEGNSSNSVKENTYTLDNKKIMGFAKLPANPDYEEEESEDSTEKAAEEVSAEETETEIETETESETETEIETETESETETEIETETETESETEEELATLTARGEDYELTVSYGEDAQIPDGTELKVEEILEGTDAYEEYYSSAQSSMEDAGILDSTKMITFARFFDVTLLYEGEEIEPAAPVQVTVTSPETLSEEDDYTAVHILDDGTTELMEAEQVVDEDGEISAVTYEQDGFSGTGTVGTAAADYEDEDISTGYSAPSTGSYTVKATISWPSGSTPTSGECVVRLYEGGSPTSSTVTLNSDNSWTAEFTGLDASKTYTVEMDSQIDGYAYTQTSEKQTGSSTTVTTSTFTQASSFANDGSTYVIVNNYNGTYNAVACNGSSLYPVAISTLNVTQSGTTYTTTSTVPDTIKWTNASNNNLYSVSGNTYLRLGSSNALGNAASITYSNYKLYRTSYLYQSSASAYGITSTASSGSSFYLYKLTTSTSTVTTSSGTVVTITAEKATAASGGSSSSGSSSSGNTFEHDKTIDSLNDGVTNPDTTLNGTDYYRLYLDMTGKTDPVDVLFVVDASGSMDKTDVTYGDTSNVARDTAITMLLNGSATATTKDGLISQILASNSENKVAVIRFYGDTSYTNTHNSNKISDSSFKTNGYKNDSDIKLDWTSTATYTDCANNSSNGTDYEAGLMRAAEMLNEDSVKNDGHKKIMIFISDGVPTYFIISNNDVGSYTSTDSSGSITTTLTQNYVGRRWGNGSYTSRDNYLPCKIPSETAYDDLIAQFPDLVTYTVGVSADINATSSDGSQSPDVLKYMVDNDDSRFFAVSEDVSTLKNSLMEIFYPKGVTITDQLSKYVRYYGVQPDVKVTMTNSSGTTVLYENGAVTAAGSGILNRVVYSPGDTGETPTGSTGTVSAIFESDYCFKPEYTYTLSFNVKTTQTAYNEYEANNSDYGGVTGDSETDYGTNTTSSNQPGFHSNTQAYVTYHTNNTLYEDTYDHPVIQVEIVYYELPSTGGTGTYWYTMGGITLIVIALVLYNIFNATHFRIRERRLK